MSVSVFLDGTGGEARERDVPDEKHGRVLNELVSFPSCLKVDLPPDGVAEVDLPVEQVDERRGVRVCVRKEKA